MGQGNGVMIMQNGSLTGVPQLDMGDRIGGYYLYDKSGPASPETVLEFYDDVQIIV